MILPTAAVLCVPAVSAYLVIPFRDIYRTIRSRGRGRG